MIYPVGKVGSRPSSAARAIAALLVLSGGWISVIDRCQAQDEKARSPSEIKSSSENTERPALHRATPDELKLWIEQLASPQFSVRERAAHQLSRCDATALETLRSAARTSTDKELQLRRLAIANAIYDWDVGKRTREFLKDPDPGKTYGFDGWIPFSEVAGTTRLSKRLFAELIAVHPDQVYALPDDTNAKAAILKRDAAQVLDKLRSGQAIELGDSVNLLYQAILCKDIAPASVDQITILLIRTAPFTTEISRPPMRSTLQKMLGQWTLRTSSDPNSVLMIAIDNNIPEGIQIARRALSNMQCEPNLFVAATAILMKFGNKDDITLLEPWRAEQKALQKNIPVMFNKAMPIPDANSDRPALESGPTLLVRPPAEMRNYELRYQDLALIASAHLAGREDILELFPRLQTHPGFVFRPDSVAFPEGDNESRQHIIDALATTPESRN